MKGEREHSGWEPGDSMEEVLGILIWGLFFFFTTKSFWLGELSDLKIETSQKLTLILFLRFLPTPPKKNLSMGNTKAAMFQGNFKEKKFRDCWKPCNYVIVQAKMTFYSL